MIHPRLMSIPILALAALSTAALADDSRPSVFTSAQARAGKLAYESTCGICHLNSLKGRVGDPSELPDPDTLPENYRKTISGSGGYVPALVGDEFMEKWGKKTAAEFAERIQNAIKGFPPQGTNDTTFLALTAYILQSNGASPGKRELTPTTTTPVSATVGRAKSRKS